VITTTAGEAVLRAGPALRADVHGTGGADHILTLLDGGLLHEA
jgi:hypothetical protein